MFDEIDPVKSLVSEIKGNTSFLEKIIFPNIKLVFGFLIFGALIVIIIIMS